MLKPNRAAVLVVWVVVVATTVLGDMDHKFWYIAAATVVLIAVTLVLEKVLDR